MKIRNLLFAAASAALVATPIAAQANTRAAGSSVAMTNASLGSTNRAGAAVEGEEITWISGGILYALIGTLLLTFVLIETTSDDTATDGE